MCSSDLLSSSFKEALKELERASGLLEDPVIFDHLGDTYLKIGDIEKAKVSWQKSLELDPKQDKIKKKIEQLMTNDKIQIPNEIPNPNDKYQN